MPPLPLSPFVWSANRRAADGRATDAPLTCRGGIDVSRCEFIFWTGERERIYSQAPVRF